MTLGAIRVDIGQSSTPWLFWADADGNGFCDLAARSSEGAEGLGD